MTNILAFYETDGEVRYPIGDPIEVRVYVVVEQEDVYVGEKEGQEDTLPGIKSWRGAFLESGPMMTGQAHLQLQDGRVGRIVITGSAVDVTCLGADWKATESGEVEFIGTDEAPR